MSSGGALPQALSNSSTSFVAHHHHHHHHQHHLQIPGFPLFGRLTQHHHHHQRHHYPFQRKEQELKQQQLQQQLSTITAINSNNTSLSSTNQRIKLKRQRQRVDAGEPRNTYQATRSPMLQQQQRFANDFQFNNITNNNNNNSSSSSNSTITTTSAATTINDSIPILNSIFPWITTTTTTATVVAAATTTTTATTMQQRSADSSSSILEQASDVDEPTVQDLSQRNADNDEHQNQQELIGFCTAATLVNGIEDDGSGCEGGFREETTTITTTANNDDDETTATMTDDLCTPNFDESGHATADECDDTLAPSRKDEENSVNEASPTPSASFTGGTTGNGGGSGGGGGGGGGGSSSRRKNAVPQRQPIDVEDERSTPQIEQNDILGDESIAHETTEQEQQQQPRETKLLDETPKNVLAASLAANLNNPQNRLQEMIDMQRRIYTNWIDQQKKLLSANDEEQKRVQIQLIQQQIQRDYTKLAQSLKQELISGLNSSVDKVIAEFIAAEAAASAQRAHAAIAEQQREQAAAAAAAAAVNRNPFLFHPLYHPFNGQSAPFPNPFMQNALPPPPPAAAQPPAPVPPTPHHRSGIFPPASAPHNAFNPFVPRLKAASPAIAALRKTDDLSPFAPRKKRSKVTDCTRVSKVQSAAATASREVSSLPDSARSSPQLSSYFPPTMVGHPLYGGATFGGDDRDSPLNSDDGSDCGAYDGNAGGSSTLTPMHLRKAKLMFFYTRYPNSALLKSYFPDIRFNKNNTAQLVKWFSNFREFFYNQMDKYARNYLAEGVKNKEDIIVTSDSEIYRNLNQHYNRNNHIQPPERLALVIQETLREFFVAVQSGRDAEPSWKKTIYKVINRMDDPIPEYFKDPNFLERLEG